MSGARAALLAAAGMLLVGGASAQAADLGGDCCADLEERVAELEATTARKGNRKVKLKVYGQVNTAVAYWDDGNEKNVYQYTNDASRSRIGFKGKAKITSDFFAGYKIEIGIRVEDQGSMTAQTDDTDCGAAPDKCIDLRHSHWFIGSKTYGTITVGMAASAFEKITQSNVARTGHFATQDLLDNVEDYQIIGAGGASIGENWDDVFQVFEPGEGQRHNLVGYKTPSIAGFVASATWGEDDVWSIALRYAGKIGDFKMKAGIAYAEISDDFEECTDINAGQTAATVKAKCRDLGMSASVMHTPTGIFVTGHYGEREDEGKKSVLAGTGLSDEISGWHVQAGIEQKWLPLGKTTFFGGYHEMDQGASVEKDKPGRVDINAGDIASAKMDMWELGMNQQISAAAMDMYIHYKHYDADITVDGGAKVDTEAFQTVITGARIKF